GDLRGRVAAERASELVIAERAARSEAESLARRLASVAAITDGLEALRLSALVAELARRLADVLGAEGAMVKVLRPDPRHPAEAHEGNAAPAAEALESAIAKGVPTTALGGAIAVPLLAAAAAAGAIAVHGMPR